MKRSKNPEAQMPLKDHLTELRKRLLISLCAIVLGSVLGWLIYDYIFDALQAPLKKISSDPSRQAQINFDGVSSSFDMKLKISFFVGLIVASPVWIYELWAFIVPGLKKKEKRLSLAFIFTAVPLFILGIYTGWMVLPSLVNALTSFTPTGASNIISAQSYFDFVMRLLLICGFTFLVPVILVGLDMAGILTGKQVLKAWRISIFLIFLCSAMAAPGADVTTMFYIAIPMIILYFLAVGVCFLIDKRKQKHHEKDNDRIENDIANPASIQEIQQQISVTKPYDS